MASSAVLPSSLLREFVHTFIMLKFNNSSNSVKNTFPPIILIFRKSFGFFKHSQAFSALPYNITMMRKINMENWWKNS
jgi:hypothetical protein